MSNQFCKNLSNGYKINVEGDQLLWSPCCFYKTNTPLADRGRLEKEMAYTSAATDWLPECYICQTIEDSDKNNKSPRLKSFTAIQNDYPGNECASLEISFDRKCNAACLSCGAYCSSTWAKYDVKHGLAKQLYRLPSSDDLFTRLIDAVPLDKLENINVMGGEPFYSDTNLKFLHHLNDVHPDLKKVTLRYQTNGSVTPSKEVLDCWDKFKSVRLNFSIDGVGDRFEYLRWPLKWHRVNRNLTYLLDNTNVTFTVSCTISPLNALYFQEIEDWFNHAVPAHRRGNALASRCTTPLDLAKSSMSLRDAVVKQYGESHSVSKMIQSMHVDTDYQSLFDYVEKHDKIRRLNWRETFPDVARHYDL